MFDINDPRYFRPCEVLSEYNNVMFRGAFHGFFVLSEIVPPSPLRGGHSGGVTSDVVAIVEDTEGKCSMVHPNRVRFIDGKSKRFIGDQEE